MLWSLGMLLASIMFTHYVKDGNWAQAACWGMFALIILMSALTQIIVNAIKDEGDRTRTILRSLESEQKAARWRS